jgi:CheY-like chemotaxis protein
VPDRSVADLAPLRTGPLILVVDDDQPDRIAATRMVRGLGYPARSFRQGRDALQFVERHPQVGRVLLADLGMPVMDGGELVERVLDADPTMRAALMADRQDPRQPSCWRATATSRSCRSHSGSRTSTKCLPGSRAFRRTSPSPSPHPSRPRPRGAGGGRPVGRCHHPEPIRCAQGKLREGGHPRYGPLHCIQGDKVGIQGDKAAFRVTR